MSDTENTIIEINGVKLEIDLRHAKRIDQLRVGDRVKVLVKRYDDYKVYPGIVVGFEPFIKQPTIIIAYVDVTYASANLEFLYFNSSSKDREIVKAIDDDQLEVSREEMLRAFDREIGKHRNSILEIEEKRAYFDTKFRAYWEPVGSVLIQ